MVKALKINLKAFKEFLHSEQIGGIILLFCVIVSLCIANSSFGSDFSSLLKYPVGYQNSALHLKYPVELWINDGLMAIFFLLVGLEIKREILEGELSSPKRAAMPVFAAAGGMLMPALIFFLINNHTPTRSGWGIPMATDIAFALAVISIIGKKVPGTLKIFLAALAIADDLGAILVIAIFYTEELHLYYLMLAGVILVVLILLNIFKVKRLIFYILPGILLWYFIHQSGIHSTISGVLLAFAIPTNPIKETSPLEKLEHYLNIPVNYFIMPVFALANTDIKFQKEMILALKNPLSIGIIAGLVLGKPLGITFFSWLSVKTGLSSLPSQTEWKHILGLGMIAGIGFTMSVFIALLSFNDPSYQAEAKFSILTGSLISGILGCVFLNLIKQRSLKSDK